MDIYLTIEALYLVLNLDLTWACSLIVPPALWFVVWIRKKRQLPRPDRVLAQLT